jgi:hypothetical protein
MPADGERLRTHAAHLLAFAVKARESGMITVANHFTARAAQCLAEAEARGSATGGAVAGQRRSALREPTRIESSGEMAGLRSSFSGRSKANGPLIFRPSPFRRALSSRRRSCVADIVAPGRWGVTTIAAATCLKTQQRNEGDQDGNP